MYRTLLSTALMAMLFLTGCGGSKGDKAGNNSGGKSAGASTPSTLPAEQQSEIGIQVNLGQIMKDEAVVSMLETSPEVPPFVKSLQNLEIYAALPANMGLASDPSNFDFFAQMTFADADSCKAAYDEVFANAPTEDVEKKGKTFKKIAEPGAPTVYILMEGASISAYSENYVNSDATSYASEGLRSALGSAPKNEPFKMAVDVEGANDFLSGLTALAPQAEAFVNSKSIVMAGGGTDELMFMMAVNTPDEDTAKKVKSTVQAGVGMLALGLASQMPSEETAPVTNEFINYMMKNMKPVIEGNSVKVVINKPENYDEMRKKMAVEAKKIQEEMLKGGPGGPGGLDLKGPETKGDDKK